MADKLVHVQHTPGAVLCAAAVGGASQDTIASTAVGSAFRSQQLHPAAPKAGQQCPCEGFALWQTSQDGPHAVRPPRSSCDACTPSNRLQGTTLDASLADELDRMQRAPQNSCDRVLRMQRSLVKWRRQLQKRGGHDVEVSLHCFGCTPWLGDGAGNCGAEVVVLRKSAIGPYTP